MKTLNITGTEDSPYVNFNFHENVYKMGGDSRPENPQLFFKPVVDWVRDLKGHLYYETQVNKGKTAYQKKLTFEFNFDYLNSISIKFVYELLKEIDHLNETEPVAKVVWHYREDDELMLENGQDYAEIVKSEFTLKELPKS